MGSPDGTKVKPKCTFSPEVGNHAEPSVRTATSRRPPGFPPSNLHTWDYRFAIIRS